MVQRSEIPNQVLKHTALAWGILGFRRIKYLAC